MDTTDSSPGKNHDKKIFDKSRFKKSIPKDIDIMSDSSYQGIKDDFPNATIPLKKNRGGPELNKEQKRENRKIARKRVRIENVIRKIKIFKIPSDKYSGNRKKHSGIFKTIAWITNIKY